MELKEHVAEIVTAYVRKNQVSADQLTQTVIAVHDALARLGQEPDSWRRGNLPFRFAAA